MIRRYSIIFLFSALLIGLAWWSRHVESSGSLVEFVSQGRDLSRQELIEVLDRIVFSERYYHSIHGRFTKVLNRLNFSGPKSLSDLYGIRVEDATTDRLLIIAFSEEEGREPDFVSIDHNYELHANFPLPPPRMNYLRKNALNHLNMLREARPGQVVVEETVFKGFFRYEVNRDTQAEFAVATGVRPPVVGLQLEVGPGSGRAGGASVAGGSEIDLQLLSDFVRKLPHTSLAQTGQRPEIEPDALADHLVDRKLGSFLPKSDLEIEPIRAD